MLQSKYMGIFDILTTAANIAKESGKLELQGEILGVYEKLLEQQKKISDLEGENKTLKEKLEIKENLVYENNIYWIEKDNKRDGPYCTCCWDSEHKLIRLHTNTMTSRVHCPNCDTTVKHGLAQIIYHK